VHCDVNGGDTPADVTSAANGSHWSSVLMVLSAEGVAVREGQTVLVHTSAHLGGAQPRYTFEAWLQDGGVWSSLGSVIEYPEASLSPNDVMDLQLDRFGA
jgi:hypothetical protein